MRYCEKCDNIKHDDGDTFVNIMDAAKGAMSLRNDEAVHFFINKALDTLQKKGGCSNCISTVQGFKNQLG